VERAVQAQQYAPTKDKNYTQVYILLSSVFSTQILIVTARAT
jgi:hypothetical protein